MSAVRTVTISALGMEVADAAVRHLEVPGDPYLRQRFEDAVAEYRENQYPHHNR